MKKIVPESLTESMQLQEGFFSDVKEKVSSFFKKVGKYFATIINGKALEVVHPVNIGIFDMEGLLPKGVHFMPSSETLKLEPALAALKQRKIMLPKTKANANESVNLNKLTKYIQTLNEAKGDAAPLPVFTHEDMEIPDVDNNELIRRIRMVIDHQHDGENSVPLLVWGTVGIAKTEIGTTVLEMLGKEDAQVVVVPLAVMAREDWSIPKEVNERAVQCYVDWLPLYKKTGDPKLDAAANDAANKGGGGILFFDEISRSSKGLISSLLTLVQSRRFGEWHLGTKWAVIAASNRLSDDPQADYNFSQALGNRFDHVNFVPSHEAWAEWAQGGSGVLPNKNKVSLGQWKRMLGNWRVDPRIVSFTEFNRDFWHTLKKNGDLEQLCFASPRTWTNASKSIDNAIQDEEKYKEGISYLEMTNIVASSVGKTAAIQFMTFMKLLQQYTTADIKRILEDPNKAPLPTKKGSGYDLAEANAIIFVVCSYTKDKPISPEQWENFNQYLARLDNASLATKGHKLMIEINQQTVESNGPFHINSQMGEVDDPKTGKKKDKYQKGYDTFNAKYGKMF